MRVEEAIERLDLEQLERLFVVALDVTTLDEFRAHLPPAGNGPDEDAGAGPESPSA